MTDLAKAPPHLVLLAPTTHDDGPSDDLYHLVNAKVFAATGLPVRKTAARSIVREDPAKTIRLVATATDPDLPLPYGVDRALLLWILTLGFQANDGIVAFSRLDEYFRAFRLPKGGDQYKRLRAAFARITALSIHVELKTKNFPTKIYNCHVIRRAVLPRREDAPATTQEQLALFKDCGFELDPDFLMLFREGFVFLPLELMVSLHSQPAEWDLTLFLLYRSRAAASATTVPLDTLRDQLGVEDANPRRTRQRLKRCIALIKTFYPDFPAYLDKDGDLAIEPWREPKNTRHALLAQR